MSSFAMPISVNIASRASTQLQPVSRRQLCAQHIRGHRKLIVRSGPVSDPKGGPKREQRRSGLDEALRSAGDVWSKLDTQQRVFIVVAGAALLTAAPQLLTLGVIVLERLLVGGLLALEEGLAGLLFMGARLVAVVGTLALLGAGAYLFLFKQKRQS